MSASSAAMDADVIVWCSVATALIQSQIAWNTLIVLLVQLLFRCCTDLALSCCCCMLIGTCLWQLWQHIKNDFVGCTCEVSF
jgi:hypothetical protein